MTRAGKDTSTGCVGCTPYVVLGVCLIVVIAIAAIALSGGQK